MFIVFFLIKMITHSPSQKSVVLESSVKQSLGFMLPRLGLTKDSKTTDS